MPRLSPSARSLAGRLLECLYPGDPRLPGRFLSRVDELAAAFEPGPAREPLGERDVWLIAYGDSFREAGEPGLSTLRKFFSRRLRGLVTTIHVLPCFPSTSDDGFAVSDYRSVEPSLGDWGDVEALAAECPLMLDAVFNHCSAGSHWFRLFLRGVEPYSRYFIELPPFEAERLVFRPRTAPLFTAFDGPAGTRRVWTTFGPDQVDLNAGEPELMLELLDIMLLYLSKGARALRLDAIGYLWKEPGTSCLHHPKTHAAIRLWRALLEDLAPGTLLVSETNVPHAENVSYFGAGDEVHMVYQFSLPPLAMHAFQTGDARHLRAWLRSLEPAPRGTAYLNFLASHDGVGLLGAKGWLPEAELARSLAMVLDRGGEVSSRTGPGLAEEPYEANISFFDAISAPEEPERRRIDAFLAAHALLLALPGVPALYALSLFGAGNDRGAYLESGIKRRINRRKLDVAQAEAELDTPGGRAASVFAGLSALIRARRGCPAFHPDGPMEPLEADPRVVSFARTPPDGGRRVLVAVNCSGGEAPLPDAFLLPGRDLLSGAAVKGVIGPFKAVWKALD